MSEAPMEDRSDPRTQRQTQRVQRNKKGRVVTYLAILFAAAFLLLLMSYFMQQRANEQAIAGLTDTLASVHSLQNLIEDNESLRQQAEEMENRLEALEEELEEYQAQAQALATQLEKTTKALDYFWQVDEAYVRGRYGLCRDLIQIMEDGSSGAALKSYLPEQSATDTDRFSPAQRYQEIYDALY